jgi:opacity protein-like surface antigen
MINKHLTIAAFLSVIALAVMSQAQATTAAQAVSYTSLTELNQLVANLQQTSQSAQLDLARLRVEKWKADSGTKQQTEKDSASINQNLQLALPSMLADLKNSPENLTLTFKVYRNLDLLYDVFGSVLESTGAFGTKEEFQSLNKDLSGLEDSRRAFADRMDKLSNAKETELGQLRAALQAARAAEATPKKVVVDDTAPPPPKKAPVHKKPTKPATPPATAPPAQPTPHP